MSYLHLNNGDCFQIAKWSNSPDNNKYVFTGIKNGIYYVVVKNRIGGNLYQREFSFTNGFKANALFDAFCETIYQEPNKEIEL